MRTLSTADNGKAVTCAVDHDARFAAGGSNVRTIAEVWNGTLRELRHLHLTGRFDELPPDCAGCRDWRAARADCHSTNP